MRIENISAVTSTEVVDSNQKADQTDQNVKGSNVAEVAVTTEAGLPRNQEGYHPEDLPRVVDLANKFTRDLLDTRKIEFKLHPDSGRTMVVVSDPVTGNVIREIPSKEFLDVVAAMDKFIGLLFDHKV